MKENIEKIIISAVNKAGFDDVQNFSVDEPPKSSMGDFATNVAMILGGRDKSNPKEVAQKLAEILKLEKDIEKAEVAGPGFINITLNNSIYLSEIEKILKQKENYCRGDKNNTKVNVEFVSANPTGPLHIGNARGGPIGEAMANLFAYLGYEIIKEFYVNDMGLQMERFGQSLYHHFAKKTDSRAEFPTDGYPAPYIEEISEEIQRENKEKLETLKDEAELVQFFIKEGLIRTIKSIREDCKLIGIEFDNFAYESDIQHSGKVEKVIEKLEEGGFTTKKEGALWFKNPDDKELADKESVLIKSDGKSFTYFADDIAYHIDKFDRGADLSIDVWGANHHGHVPRFKAAMKAMGEPENKIAVIFYQYIRLLKDGKAVSMGKRLGNFVTLREVIESGVEPDAFKYFILAQNSNTPFDFDLKKAADTSEKNPVFYIKYAHARICSILKKMGQSELDESDIDLRLLTDKKETALYKELVKFPEILIETSENFQIQALPHYAYKIAGLFHDFYTNCQVITEDKKLSSARLSLVLATKYILENLLCILAIEAPESM